jgi:methyltransferase (TIGR00027 family)
VTRTDSDSWDLASGVGITATMVAAARALASAEPEPLIHDPFAAPLVRAVGVEHFVGLVDGTAAVPEQAADAVAMLTAVLAVRTRFFDDFFADAAAAGVRQAVILASGLDSRAYRLDWPAGTTVYEIDQQAVLDGKNAALAALGAAPTAERRAVTVDLREDWPAALRAAGFDTAAPTAWIAEGLLIYLPPQAQDRLFDNITALSAPGSRLATEFHRGDVVAALNERSQQLADSWKGAGVGLDFAALTYRGERNDAAQYLAERGWSVTGRARTEVFAGYGRAFPTGQEAAGLSDSTAIVAIRD